jgi:predicted lipid-binding transport protein (Tim44 family)
VNTAANLNTRTRNASGSTMERRPCGPVEAESRRSQPASGDAAVILAMISGLTGGRAVVGFAMIVGLTGGRAVVGFAMIVGLTGGRAAASFPTRAPRARRGTREPSR